MASLNQGILSKIEIDLPERCIQDRIVSIIAVLDKKRKTNEKLNKNLEQQAQAIYSRMFIEHRQESWSTGQLSDLISVKYGKDHKKLADGNYPVYGSGGCDPGGFVGGVIHCVRSGSVSFGMGYLCQ